MKHLLAISVLAVLYQSSIAQSVNVNPDPNGKPWIAGVPPLTEEGEKRLAELTSFSPMRNTRAALPTSVDNGSNKYFRPIFDQDGNSCAQASGIGYILTYEMARVKDLDASLSENWFASHYTWHYFNGGTNRGSWPYQGWDIVAKNGCMTYEDFGGAMNGNDPSWTKWESGFDKYRRGMKNRVKMQGKIENIETPEGLANLKQYLYDCGKGEATGGIVSFSALSSKYVSQLVPEGDHKDELILTRWGTGGAHMMTIVGYDDSVKVDINGDGRYTNDEDINSDGAINMLDWEIGALKMANTWGNDWGDGGFAWLSYSLIGYGIADKYDAQKNGGIYRNLVYYIEVDTSHVEQQSIKLKAKYTNRFGMTMIVGVAQDTNATEPAFFDTIAMGAHTAASNSAEIPMGGVDVFEPIEMGFDITDVMKNIDASQNYKLFITVDRKTDHAGTIDKIALVDHTDGDKEYYSSDIDVDIATTGSTLFSIVKNGKGATHEMNDPVLLSNTSLNSLIGSPLNLNVTVQDESSVSSVTVNYTIGTNPEKSVALTQTSVVDGIYSFTGSIPAQDTAAKGTVTFTMTDQFGNSETCMSKVIEWATNFELGYDTEDSEELGVSSGDTYIPVIRLTENELKPFYGSGKLTMMKYVLDREEHAKWIDTVELKIYRSTGDTPTEEIYTKLIDVNSDIIFDDWTTHVLDTPIDLEDGYSYWIGYKIVFGYGWFVSFDEGYPEEGKSNCIFYKGEWTTLTELNWGLNGAWNIHAVIEDDATAAKPKLLKVPSMEAEKSESIPVTIECADDKGFASVTAYYRYGTNTETAIEMNQTQVNSKISNFATSLPAPNYSTRATVRFELKDSDGNITSSEIYPALWRTYDEVHYDSEHNRNIGNGRGDRFTPTIRLPEDMFQANESAISGLRFYIDPDDGIGNIENLTIRIYESDPSATEPTTEIYTYDFTQELTTDGWQTHILPTFIERDNSKDYWVGYDIDFIGGFFAGMQNDTSSTVAPDNAHYIFFRGKWITLKDWNFEKARWNIRALVEPAQEVAIELQHMKVQKAGLLGVTPKGGKLNFSVNLLTNESVKISVFNLKGQRLRSVELNNLNAGTHQLGVESSSLSKGIYLYSINIGPSHYKGKCLVK